VQGSEEITAKIFAENEKGFVTFRVDSTLKEELVQASQLEHRSLSNFGRLLLEYAWGQYLKAGSIKELLEQKEEQTLK
jgi:hypothetical protein